MGQSRIPAPGVKVAPFQPFKRRFAIAWCAVALAFWGVAVWRHAAARRPDPTFSPLADAVTLASPAPLRRAEGARARVFAVDPARAAQVLEEAEFALPEIARLLRVPEPSRSIRIFLVPAIGGWEPLVTAQGFRPDGLAVNIGDEIFLKDDPQQMARPDRLAHELVHVVLREAYGSAIPLWLDEGLAGRIGLTVSRAHRAAKGRRLSGQWPGHDPAWVDPLPTLTSRTALPDDPARAQAFYRAAEELVALMEDMMAPAHWPDFVAEVARGADWRQALASRVRGSAIELDSLEASVRRAVQQPRKL